MLCSAVLSILLYCAVLYFNNDVCRVVLSRYVVSNHECCRRWLIPAKQRTQHRDSQMIRGYKKHEKPRGIIDHAGEPCSNGAVSQPLHTGHLYFRSFKVASRLTITSHKHFTHQRNSIPVWSLVFLVLLAQWYSDLDVLTSSC